MVNCIIGIYVCRNHNKHLIHINQNKYVLEKFALYGMVHCKPISTLMTFGTKLTQAMSPQTPQEIATMSAIPYANVTSFMPLLQLNLILLLLSTIEPNSWLI
jgi:hypothetical protein